VAALANVTSMGRQWFPRRLNPKREGPNYALIKAAVPVQVDHVKRPENWRLVEAARVVYSAGFFITVSPESILLVGKHCAEHSKIYCMNLSAPFISEARAAPMSPAAALSRGLGELPRLPSHPLHMLKEQILLNGDCQAVPSLVQSYSSARKPPVLCYRLRCASDCRASLAC